MKITVYNPTVYKLMSSINYYHWTVIIDSCSVFSAWYCVLLLYPVATVIISSSYWTLIINNYSVYCGTEH